MISPKISFFAILILLGLIISNCVKHDFDAPPGDGQPINLTSNTTIQELKAMHIAGQFESISDDLIIEGVVIADDESGNYYKTIVIQDGTAGIDVKINTFNLFNDFPEGRKIFIKCKDLVLGDYNNLIQLGGGTYESNGNVYVAGIEELIMSEHLFGDEYNQTITPTVKTISQLSDADVSTLITLEDVQFIQTDAGNPYATDGGGFATNREIEDCDENTLILRTSDYASFVNTLTPTGKGSITFVYSVYRTDGQAYIRDTDDVMMDDDRCDGGGGGGTDPVDEIDETFESQSGNQPVSLNGWMNVATKGTRIWLGKEYGGNLYAQATAYNDSEPEMETWLISPHIILDDPKTLTFESAMAFFEHDGLSVWISTDFDGDVNSATWQALSCTLAGNTDPDNDFIWSGDIDLSAYSGTGVIGFKYVGSGPNGLTTSFRLDNIKVKHQ